MSEREKLRLMLNRVNGICNRTTADICQRIKSREGLDKLDELFTLGERGHALYLRIYKRFEATESTFIKSMWESMR